MCGRFTSFLTPKLIAEIFGVPVPDNLEPRYNIAPTQKVPIVRESGEGHRFLSSARWGLVPHWADDIAIGNKMINARSETIHERASFRQAIRTRRCIFPVSGFYEWSTTPDGKIPHYITLRDELPLAIAGIWETWKFPDGQELESCAILTTAANSLLAGIHDRMPVILHQVEFALWLDRTVNDPHKLQNLYLPYPSELMQRWKVSPLVNSPAHDSIECVQPLQTAP